MKLTGIIVVALFCFQASFASIEVQDDILILTKDNFEEAKSSHDYLLIEFYDPCCGHCKEFAPEYVKTAAKLVKDGSNVKLGKVDATIETELAEKYKIAGYPTLKFFRKGSSTIKYGGKPQVDDIVNWLAKKMGPAAKKLDSVEDATNLIKSNNVVVIGFFNDVESDAAKVLLEVAYANDKYAFGITSNNDVLAECEAKNGDIILFNKVDEGKVVYDGELAVNKLEEFISTNAVLPLIMEFDDEAKQKVLQGESHLLVFLSKESGHYEKYVKRLEKLAKYYSADVSFATVNVDVNDNKALLESFGLKKENAPAIRLFVLEQLIAKYSPVNPDLETENVKSFVGDFVDGKLKRYLDAQDLPEDWDATPVKTLVSSNFADVALNKEKDVLVEFYAPWCGYCRQFAPIYDDLGKKFKDSETVVIAKVDATLNELEGVKINRYPTIILFKKETNEAVRYRGELTLEDVSKFLESGGVDEEFTDEASPVTPTTTQIVP